VTDGRVRVALIHGLGGTAATMRPLALALEHAGYDCQCVMLPGHGGDPADLAGATWEEWLAAVPDADVLVGQSLGGALAMAAAPDREAVRAVVAINAPAADPDAVEGLEWLRSRGHDWVDGPPLADGEVGFTRLPLAAVDEMARGVLHADLSRVQVPTLLATGALDEVADPGAVDRIAAALGGPVTRLVLPASGHTATFGPDLPLLVGAIDALVGPAA
jgi:carboxylesterase